MKNYAFIDASNLFYGGQKSLGWSIDYEKLIMYLKDKYGSEIIYFFGGIEIYGFEFDYQSEDTISLERLELYLLELIRKESVVMPKERLQTLAKHIKRTRFYIRLREFGYTLILKPVKIYRDKYGGERRKANCDVEMTFYLMEAQELFDSAIILSGDGDFLPVLKYLRNKGKEIIIIAHSDRTAKEIRRFAGPGFRDFEYLRERLQR